MSFTILAADWFALIAATGALFSTITNGAAYWRVRTSRSPWVKFLGFNTALSLVYVLAWSALLFNVPVDRSTWSELITPFSALSFFTTWAGPGLYTLLTLHSEVVEGRNEEEWMREL